MTKTECPNFVWHTDGLVELCGWFTRCPECERRHAALRAYRELARVYTRMGDLWDRSY